MKGCQELVWKKSGFVFTASTLAFLMILNVILNKPALCIEVVLKKMWGVFYNVK